VKKLLYAGAALWLATFTAVSWAVPTEVLSNVTVTEKGGIDAVRIDFALPVNYVSHSPGKHGSRLIIKVRFDPNLVPDTSELPLLQSLSPPASDAGPLIDVTYVTEDDEPQLILNFKEDVNFTVSQVAGITNLMIFLPESLPDTEPDPMISPSPATEPLSDLVNLTEEEEQAKKMLDEGRRALRKSKYKDAVNIFTAMMSMPENRFSQPALELLGVARERNNQAAQAKAIYEQYLEKYPEGQEAIRVRQRLAELIAAQMKPKKKLKESKTAQRRKEGNKFDSQWFGTLSQYVDYRDSYTDTLGHEVEDTRIDNQLSLSWRLRNETWDIRNYTFLSYEYDTIEGESDDGVEVSSLYSRIRNLKHRYYATVGRHLGSTPGVLGRFDGLTLGYDIRPKLRINGVYGYPVDTFDKQTIQTNIPTLGFSVDFVGYVKGLDVAPYIINQEVDGITNRQAVGVETRYFAPRFNFFNLVDYDIFFDDLNIFMLQGQIILQKRTALTFNVDHRKSPLLETSNALIQLGNDVYIEDLLNGNLGDKSYTEDELKDIAVDRTGEASLVTLGVSHSFSRNQQLAADVTYSRQKSRTINVTVFDPTVDDVLAIPAVGTTTKYVVGSLQLVSTEMFFPRDTTINTLQFTNAETYDEATYRISYRVPVQTVYRIEPRLMLRRRDSDSGERLLRTIPGVRVIARTSRNFRIYSELDVEIWNFSGDTNQEDFRETLFYIGYSWDFLQR
jgi:hypothetical protein